MSRHSFAVAVAGILLVLPGCGVEPSMLEYADPGDSVLDAPPLDDVPGQRAIVEGEDFDGMSPPTELGGDDPRGEIVIDEFDMVVEVGEEVWLSFSAVVYDIDPSSIYLTVSNAPAGAQVDLVEGILYWIPTIEDVGVHAVGIDLWYESEDADQRILDAQRVIIEVIPVPVESLIEVGI